MRTLYRNGRILGAARATALLVDGATIAGVGLEADAGAAGVGAVVDLAGALVTPAFVDTHVHATSTGLALDGLDLHDATSAADVLNAVASAARTGRGRPIIGGGWDEHAWADQRLPSAAELDRASYGGVVYLARVDVHSALVSSALLAAVPGLPATARSGWVSEAAHSAVRAVALDALSPAQTRELQRTALRRAAALGIACLHENAGPSLSSADDLAGLLELSRTEPVPEVIGYWGELFGIETALAVGAAGAAGDLFCDGSLGSRTAALHEAYTDDPGNRGELHLEADDIAEHVLRCTAAGLQAGLHAIGDRAVDTVLAGLEQAGERLGRPGGTGHRIEHLEYVHDPRRLAATGVGASMQPMFDGLWGGTEGLYAQRLGPERALRLNRLADLAAAGVPLGFGSDSPVTALGPWAAVRAAATHHDPAASLDPDAAFAGHTSGGWALAGRSAGGPLRPGQTATFAVWDTPATTVADVIAAPGEPACIRTVRDGNVIHEVG